MEAVHFGAGNIGRGFVGLMLREGGYDIVFSDVSAALVDAINAVDHYTVHEVGPGGSDHVVTGFRAINSASDPDAVIDAVASAQVVTTAVGVNVLPFVAPLIVAGLRRRSPALAPVAVMACENAVGATDLLRAEMTKLLMHDAIGSSGDRADVRTVGAQHPDAALPASVAEVLRRAVFANTAVDRIVPAQGPGGGVNVTVEPYAEWAIESAPFGANRPRIPGAHFVDDLAPYIERKLFTVNTGHASVAYFGALHGIELISDALAHPQIAADVTAVLEETSAVLHAVHGLDRRELATYRATILERFRNPALPDTVRRVGRQPLRKLGRHDRFIAPAALAAEHSLSARALVRAVAAALAFDDAGDAEAVELQHLLHSEPAEALTTWVTGLEPAHPLYDAVREAVQARQEQLRA